MDVTCERCSTEYEFDDALVSERGTTVKCTTCGHQFKVRRSDGLGAPERWLVRTVDGRELEFTALRELQAAIGQARITRDDVLSRGSTRPRRLGSIAELDPFFGQSTPGTSPGLGAGPSYPPVGGIGVVRSRMQTPAGLGAVPAGPPLRHEGSVAIPLPIAPTRSYEEPPLVARRPGSIPPGAAELPRVQPPPMKPGSVPPPALPGVVVSPMDAPPLPDAMVARMPMAPVSDAAVTLPTAPAVAPIYVAQAPPVKPASVPPPPMGPPIDPFRSSEPSSDSRAADPGPAPRPGGSRPVPRASDPPIAAGRRGHQSVPPAATPTPTDVRSSYTNEDAYTDPRFSSVVPSKRSSAARLIVGIVAAGLVVFVGVTVGRKYLSTGGAPAKAGPTEVSDERLATLLHGGEKALGEGDLELAKEQLDKASVLAEKDPRLLTDLARLAVAKADVAWLKLQLLASDDPDHAVVKKELDDAAARAQKAAERAADAAPSEPAVVRARIDALRIAGDRAAARKLTSSAGNSGQPETALVLAALDLAEDKPDWTTVIERLRAATRAEQGLGRARSMLVYALARSGDAAGAKVELDQLAALPRPHPLVRLLRAFVARGDKDAGKTVEISELPDAAGKPSPPKDDGAPPPKRSGGTSGAGPGDDGRVPDDYVAPGEKIDTSDLPGHPPSTATAQPTAPPAPPPTAAPPPPPGPPPPQKKKKKTSPPHH